MKRVRMAGSYARGLVVRGFVVGILTSAACGDDAEPDAQESKSPSAGTSGTRDAGVDSGRTPEMRRPTAGTTAPVDYSAYGCKPKSNDPGGSAREGTACCGGQGVCTEADNAAPDAPHDICSADDLRCVPAPSKQQESSSEDAGTRHAQTCRVQLPGTPASGPDYEGRCVLTCFVKTSTIFSRLSQANCPASYTCTPCYNPLTGETTGACDHDGDAPAEPKPTGFAECGNGLGYCVPVYAAGTQASQLSQLSCASGELCAPKIKAADPSACFPHCVSPALGPGACVPAFLTTSFAALLTQETCETSELCAPCEIAGFRPGVCD